MASQSCINGQVRQPHPPEMNTRDMDWDLDSAHYSYIDDSTPTVWHLPHFDQATPRTSQSDAASGEEVRFASGVKPISGDLLRKLARYIEIEESRKVEKAAEECKERPKQEAEGHAKAILEQQTRRGDFHSPAAGNKRESEAREECHSLWRKRRPFHRMSGAKSSEHKVSSTMPSKQRACMPVGVVASKDVVEEIETKEPSVAKARHSKHDSSIVRILGSNGEEAFIEVPSSLLHQPIEKREVEAVSNQARRHDRQDKRRKREKHSRRSDEQTREGEAKVSTEAFMSRALPDESKSSHFEAVSRSARHGPNVGVKGFFQEILKSLHSRPEVKHSRYNCNAVTGNSASFNNSKKTTTRLPAEEPDEQEPTLISFKEVGAAWYGKEVGQKIKHTTPESRSKAWPANTSIEPLSAFEKVAAPYGVSRQSNAKPKDTSMPRASIRHARGDWQEVATGIRSTRSPAQNQHDDNRNDGIHGLGQLLEPDDSISAVVERASQTSLQEQRLQKSTDRRSYTSIHRKSKQIVKTASPRRFEDGVNGYMVQENVSNGAPTQPDETPDNGRGMILQRNADTSRHTKPPTATTFGGSGLRRRDTDARVVASKIETLASKSPESSLQDWAQFLVVRENADRSLSVPEHNSTTSQRLHQQSPYTSTTFQEIDLFHAGQSSRQPTIASRFPTPDIRSWGGFYDGPGQQSLHARLRAQLEDVQSRDPVSSAQSSRNPSAASHGFYQTSDQIQSLSEGLEENSSSHHLRPPTIFAGKGWISPHPLSRASTGEESPPDSKIILPGDAFAHDGTMTYEEWQKIQERGLREHRNFSITESSQGRTARLMDSRYRFAGWGAHSSDGYRFEQEERDSNRTTSYGSNYRPPTVTSEHSSERTQTARVGEQRCHTEHIPAQSRRSRYQSERRPVHDGTMATRSSYEREPGVMEEGRNVGSAIPTYERSERRRHERREGYKH